MIDHNVLYRSAGAIKRKLCVDSNRLPNFDSTLVRGSRTFRREGKFNLRYNLSRPTALEAVSQQVFPAQESMLVHVGVQRIPLSYCHCL